MCSIIHKGELMNTRKELSRITIDIPIANHRRLKALAAILGKSMRDIVVDSIEEHLHKVKIPNKKTLEALANIESKKDLIETKDAEDLFKKLGI
jgi:ribosomal 50S subunit-associated protein YjgA (DUF615 family)